MKICALNVRGENERELYNLVNEKMGFELF